MLKGFLIKTYCLNIILYGLELISITKIEMKLIRTTVTGMIKSLLGLNKFCHTEKLLYALRLNKIEKIILLRKIINNCK